MCMLVRVSMLVLLLVLVALFVLVVVVVLVVVLMLVHMLVLRLVLVFLLVFMQMLVCMLVVVSVAENVMVNYQTDGGALQIQGQGPFLARDTCPPVPTCGCVCGGGVYACAPLHRAPHLPPAAPP